MTQPTTHGGPRKGSGRPPLEGRKNRTYALTDRHVELLDQYRQRHSLNTNSAALRHLIESSEKK